MTLGKRMYWVVALVAVLALAGAAVTLTSRLTSAGASDTTPVACAQQDAADVAAEAAKGPETDAIECGPQNEPGDGAVASGASTDTVVLCSDPTGAADSVEAKGAPDTDKIEEQCGP
jgi:hypothetical protein